jgi:hypothetical protein
MLAIGVVLDESHEDVDSGTVFDDTTDADSDEDTEEEVANGTVFDDTVGGTDGD